jgi:hypothetical protein
MDNKAKYWVTMTDRFMSGWGMADGKINKLVFECATFEEALIVEENAKNRSDQKHINIRSTKPYYNANRYYAQTKTKDDYNSWYQKGSF